MHEQTTAIKSANEFVTVGTRSHKCSPRLTCSSVKTEALLRQACEALPDLKTFDPIRVNHQAEWRYGIVAAEHPARRSFVVETDHGSTLRRNRSDIVKTREPIRPLHGPDIDDIPTAETATETSNLKGKSRQK